jgi:hypothetical protein
VLDVVNVPLAQFHLGDCDTTGEPGFGSGTIAVSTIPAPLTTNLSRTTNGLAKGK